MQIYDNFSTCKLFATVFSKKTPFPHFYFTSLHTFPLGIRQRKRKTRYVFFIFQGKKCKNHKKSRLLKIFRFKTGVEKKVTQTPFFLLRQGELFPGNRFGTGKMSFRAAPPAVQATGPARQVLPGFYHNLPVGKRRESEARQR